MLFRFWFKGSNIGNSEKVLMKEWGKPRIFRRKGKYFGSFPEGMFRTEGI